MRGAPQISGNMNSWTSEEEENDLDDIVAMMVTTGQFPDFDRTSAEEALFGRKPLDRNKDRDFTAAKKLFDPFYFMEDKLYVKINFERRLGMQRAVFARFEADLTGKGEFKERRDETAKYGINARLKVISDLRVLAYGMSYDQVHGICGLSESSTLKSFFIFSTSLLMLKNVDTFGDQLKTILVVFCPSKMGVDFPPAPSAGISRLHHQRGFPA